MKAVILAAGHGTRLWPLSESVPKVMTPICNRPLIDFVVSALVESEVRDIAVVVGHQKEAIISHLGDGSRLGARISYHMQDRPLGTAHALLCARPHLDEPFLVIPGDNLIDSVIIREALEAGSANVLMMTQSDISKEYGVVTLQGSRVVGIEEKPRGSPSGIISTGIYRLLPEVVPMLEREVADGVFGLSSALSRNLSMLDLEGVMTRGRWRDAVYPWDVLSLSTEAMGFKGQSVMGNLEEGVVLRGSVHIGRGTRIRAGCYIEGPVHIGEGCDIGPFVTISPHTSIGNGVRIDPYSLISGSVVYDAARIGSHCHLSRSLLGRGCSLSSSCQLASGPAVSVCGDSVVRHEDLGAIIGPGTTMESGVSVRPGVLVGSGCRVLAGATLRSDLRSHTEAA